MHDCFWQQFFIQYQHKHYAQVVFRLIDTLVLEPEGIDLRYLQCQPLRQMKHSPKLAILQSLDAMDQLQMEEVMLYIKGLLNKPSQANDYQSFKREAMKEIRQALRQEKKGYQISI